MTQKKCSKCRQQLPVACKTCRCGFSFKPKKGELAPPEDSRRRTSRVRREKPNYYDSLEFEKQVKKTRSRVSECDDDHIPPKASKPKKRKMKKEVEEEEEGPVNLTSEKQLQCLIILSELNRKMGAVTWKPD